MGERSGSNRRVVFVRGRCFEVCGPALASGSKRCRPRRAAAYSRSIRSLSPRLVAFSSCLTFLAALALSSLAVSRGPNGFVPADPQKQLPIAAVARHSIDDLFAAAGR